MRVASILFPLAFLTACESTPPRTTTLTTAQGVTFERGTPEYRGLKFARNRCADCHEVETAAASPVRGAPTFVAVADVHGTDAGMLADWLRKPHDYPDAMYFEIPSEHIDDLVAYLVTLAPSDTPQHE